jgi:hypothetical protein
MYEQNGTHSCHVQKAFLPLAPVASFSTRNLTPSPLYLIHKRNVQDDRDLRSKHCLMVSKSTVSHLSA